ncbi:ovarian tumour, partial [Striga asiatica]
MSEQNFVYQDPAPSTQYGYDHYELPQQNEYYYQQPIMEEPARYTHPLIHEIPSFFQPYVIGIEDRLDTVVEITAETCGCQLRTSCGLPCAHELNFYMKEDLFIPLQGIDVFWRTLDIPDPTVEEEDDVTCDAELERFKKGFADQPKSGKVSFLRKLRGIFEPSTYIVGEPSVHKNIRGRPSSKSSKDKQVLPNESRRHSCSSYRPAVQSELNEPPRHSEYVYRDLPPKVDPPQCSSYMPFSFDLNDLPPMSEHNFVYQDPAPSTQYEIDVFWRTLDIPDPTVEEEDDVTCDAELERFKKGFADQPKSGK